MKSLRPRIPHPARTPRASPATAQRGGSVVHFAIALPLLLLVIFGILMLSWLVTNSVLLARAAGAGATFFANQEKSPAALSDTLKNVRDAAPSLGDNLTITATVAGTACTDATTPTCGNALLTGAGGPATLTVTYTFTPPFSVSLRWLPAWPTTLSSTIALRVKRGAG